jgi:hypothetical protein
MIREKMRGEDVASRRTSPAAAGQQQRRTARRAAGAGARRALAPAPLGLPLLIHARLPVMSVVL